MEGVWEGKGFSTRAFQIQALQQAGVSEQGGKDKKCADVSYSNIQSARHCLSLRLTFHAIK